MDADELRRTWNDFFVAKQHTRVPSAPLKTGTPKVMSRPTGERPGERRRASVWFTTTTARLVGPSSRPISRPSTIATPSVLR